MYGNCHLNTSEFDSICLTAATALSGFKEGINISLTAELYVVHSHMHKNVLVNHPRHSVTGSLPGNCLKTFEYFELRFILPWMLS